MLKKNGGITLIALVITIIVLLILAGVSIAMLSGDNGVLKRGSQASAENEIGAANDAVSLWVSDKVAQYYEDVYVSNTVAATTTLDSYLGTNVKEADLITAIGNTKITGATNLGTGVKAVEVKTKTTEDSAIVLDKIVIKYKDTRYTYTSTGTVDNSKITWAITKE